MATFTAPTALKGGTCYAHGKYTGTQCPLWPSCAVIVAKGGQGWTGFQKLALRSDSSLRLLCSEQ